MCARKSTLVVLCSRAISSGKFEAPALRGLTARSCASDLSDVQVAQLGRVSAAGL